MIAPKNFLIILIATVSVSIVIIFAILEILGMEKTFHEEFEILDSKFTKLIPLENAPKYGWKTTPVTLEITYDESIVYMKTEIYNEGEIPSPVIFSQSEL